MTLRWVPGWNGLTEPEAVSYVAAVEAADGEPLEYGVARAINDFVLGCKNDGIWSAIKASCILAGARTLNGALVPLVGAAPTNYNFVSGDYNRETGLVGDGSAKYLDSNRNNNADPQNNKSVGVYISTLSSQTGVFRWSLGDSGSTVLGQWNTDNKHYGRVNDQNTIRPGSASPETGFVGASRNTASSITFRVGQSDYLVNPTNNLYANVNMHVFKRNNVNTPGYSNARLAFYSIGESLDLALLDTRVSTLITAIGAAIP
jgi:hypothetical protein